MVAVVEHEQELPEAQMRGAGLDEGLMGVRRSSERGGDGGWQERRIAQRGKIDEDDTVGKLLRHVVSDGEGQAGLPNTTRSGECEKGRGLIEQGGSRGSDLPLPSHERGPRQGQHIGMVERY